MEINYKALGMCLCFVVTFFFIVFKIIQAQMAYVFTEKYSEIKKQHPLPLKTWRWKICSIGWERASSCIGVKVEVYPNMLLVSALGQALSIPYDQYTLKYEQSFIKNALLIEKVPLYQGGILYIMNGCHNCTNLRIFLSSRKIKTILEIANQTQNQESSPSENFI